MKVSLYPKTTRASHPIFQITEKLDGSNLGLFNVNGRLLVAMRENAIYADQIKDYDKQLYPGLIEYVEKYGQTLVNNLYLGSGLFGEWLATGKIKYPDIPHKLVMFAKATITGSTEDDLKIDNLMWNVDLFKYPFIDQVIPGFIGTPAWVRHITDNSIEALDELYDEVCKCAKRAVEGFVILNEQSGVVTKYVRCKRGKLTKHKLPK